MTALWIITGLALAASLIADRRKTQASLIKGLEIFRGILPALLGVLALASLAMAALSPEMLERALVETGPLPFFSAICVGSIALMPGFIAFPLAGVLKQQGASVAMLSAFITSLMMVGVLTLPIEARFFGWKISLLRNSLALAGALIVAAGMAWVLT